MANYCSYRLDAEQTPTGETIFYAEMDGERYRIDFDTFMESVRWAIGGEVEAYGGIDPETGERWFNPYRQYT